MLRSLEIRNLAVVDKLLVEFESGLNVLTGETGAGKSIIVGSIGAVAGNKLSADVVRSGERMATVEAVFDLGASSLSTIREQVSGGGIEIASNEITIRREIYATGRSRTFINDQVATLHLLKNLAPSMLELHVQGEQHSLTNPATQMDLLDRFGACHNLRQNVRDAFVVVESRAEKLSELLESLSRSSRERDFLEYQLSELVALDPKDDEDEELLAERSLLINSERIMNLTQGIYGGLYEHDDSVLSKIDAVKRRLIELAEYNPRAAAHVESIESAAALVTDVAQSVIALSPSDEEPTARLDIIEERLSALDKLKRKYGGSLRSLIDSKAEIERQLERLQTAESLESELTLALREAEQEYIDSARRLSECRKKAAKSLTENVNAVINHVALSDAGFDVKISGQDLSAKDVDEQGGTNRQGWSARGVDRAEFMFTANVGEELRPLAQVASGGELSRLMLAIHSVCRDNMPRETVDESLSLIFDEIDVGISGQVAEVIGRRLADLASKDQVLCITHQPQIAKFADAHLVVAKSVSAGRTRSTVKKLNHQQRVREIARLIAADEDAASAQQTAAWLLDKAKDNKHKLAAK